MQTVTARVEQQQAAEQHASRKRVETWGQLKASIEAQGVVDGTPLRGIFDMDFPSVVEVSHEDINAPFGIEIRSRR